MHRFLMLALLAGVLSAAPLSPQDWISQHVQGLFGPMTSSLAVTWKDCGVNADAKILTVTPSSIALGATTTLTGTGTLNKQVTGGTFTMTMTGIGGLKLVDCSGDASKAQSCDIKVLGLKLGSLDFAGVTFPVPAGPTSGIPKISVTLPKNLPASASSTTTDVTVTDTAGNQMMCITVDTKPAAMAASSSEDAWVVSQP
eukprot:TRINITY_DN54297_c0_g1_i1.p2 TRINITY_DN54297_c0_g1~~TRINITY_DN54297_c0_g1_i1.p2  ORF type:complete len:199 (+),score=46.40 TRINITY_DN54297_c0_g1_i1:144-740(+)